MTTWDDFHAKHGRATFEVEFAETICDIGRKPLRRRDRAALVLALECLRTPPKKTSVPCYALDALPFGLRDEWNDARNPGFVAWRLLRARLALLLRVLLRVDGGDYEVTRPVRRFWYHDDGKSFSSWTERERVQFAPLWFAAPAHSPSITPAMRREGRTG